jgi:hypothetical protein
MKDETPRQFAARRGFSISYKGKTLLSTIDPAALADRTVDEASKLNRTLYFCPSPLFGYGIGRLLEQITSDSAVICVEADEHLMALSQEAMRELLMKHKRLQLVGTADPGTLCASVRKTWGERSFRRVEVLRLNGGWHLSPELYEALALALQKNIAVYWGNAMTLEKLGRRYALNALRNLSLLFRADPLSSLSFGAAPTLVLGAGPSLDQALDFLEACFGLSSEAGAGGRPFRIVCVDTCLVPLRERNIKPDLAVALESQHWNLRDFVGLGDWELPVAMDLSALPATAEMLGGKPILFSTPWTGLSLFRRLKHVRLLPEVFPPLGSVGLTASALARRLTTGPIIIAGIDFSFTPDQFHCRSSPGYQDRLCRQTRLSGLINGEAAFHKGVFSALSKTGGTVRSDPVMKGYRDLFEQEFSTDSRFRDIAGPGLPLGIKTLAPEEAVAILAGGTDAGTEDSAYCNKFDYVKRRIATETFIQEELDRLLKLRDMLAGKIAADPALLETLLDDCGYLWAHFPDCAGADVRRPPASDLGFLKRVRAELDPFIAVLKSTPLQQRLRGI